MTTYETSTAVMIADALATHMTKGNPKYPEGRPTVELVGDSAQFAVDTPLGRFRIDVTELDR